MKKLKVGILGATGMVGQRFIQILESHPWFEIEILAASKKSKGVEYCDAVKNRWVMDSKIPDVVKSKIVMDSADDCEKICSLVDFVFCAINMEKEKLKDLEYRYAKNECPVISNNSAHRWTPDVPILIPEVNPEHAQIIDFQRKRLNTKRGFIATKPNCSIQCFVHPVFPLLKFGLKFMVVSTYQAISGAGKTFSNFPEIVDNLIPYIEGEETKTEIEPLKIFGSIKDGVIVNSDYPKIFSTCVRVPTSNGHLASIFARFEKSINADEIINIWSGFNPITLPSSPKSLIKYFSEKDRPQVSIDRLRGNGMGINLGHLRQISDKEISFIGMSHNTIRGAAGGAVLLAEFLYKKNYLH